ncbi:MAG: nodulation protein NfeD [Methanosarcinaceae archaeon]|nr:nodulation protein NfeD [Methanosarcinaceae archaeon]
MKVGERSKIWTSRKKRIDERKENEKVLLSFFFLTFILFSWLVAPVTAGPDDRVLVLEISEAITPASDNLVIDALEKAESEGFEALLISLDTPGGGLEETQGIIKAMENASVPVIGYVPESGKAWSAGTLILFGTDIAGMAPFTVLGSAQPVQISPSGTEPVKDDKIINALVKFSVTTARKHGRNETFAEEVITKNKNLDAEEALNAGVIEYVAPSIPTLLAQIDGEKAKGKILRTENAKTEPYKPPLPLNFLSLISNPVLSSLLLTIGLYGIIFGISNPGAGAELFGIIAIVLGLIGTGFDISIGAIFLIILGIGLMILELQSPGFGIFGISGLVSLVLGSIFLVPLGAENIYTPEFQRLLILTVVTPTIVFGLFLVFAIYKVAESRKKKPAIGTFRGERAQTIDSIGPEKTGFVRYRGEYWKARAEEAIEKGEDVEIIGKEEHILLVKRKE